jgi:hypothetical protein
MEAVVGALAVAAGTMEEAAARTEVLGGARTAFLSLMETASLKWMPFLLWRRRSNYSAAGNRQASNFGMTEQVHWVGATGKDASRTGQSKVKKEAKLSAPPLVDRRMLRCPDSLGCSV